MWVIHDRSFQNPASLTEGVFKVARVDLAAETRNMKIVSGVASLTATPSVVSSRTSASARSTRGPRTAVPVAVVHVHVVRLFNRDTNAVALIWGSNILPCWVGEAKKVRICT